MTTNNAPDPNFSGIDFNDSFFSSTSGAYVNYPTAQGTVTFPKVLAGEIDSSNPSGSNNLFNTVTGNLNIATNGTTGQTIKIGASTLASVHCGNIDHQGNNINNANNASAGTLNMGNSLTTGTLNLGTNTARSGTINLGNGVGATGTVYVGSTSGSTVLNGTVSVNGIFALPSILTTQQLNAQRAIDDINIAYTSTSGNVGIGAVQTSGILNLGTNTARTGAINLGNGVGSSGGINIGVSGNTTTIGGALSTNAITASGNISTTGTGTISTASTGKMQSSYYDAIADTASGTTALTIGSNVILGDIEIGNAQTTGDIKIGQSDVAGATITIGKSATATTINGSVTTANLLTATGGITTTGNISTTGAGTITSAGTLTATGGVKSQSLDVITASADLTFGGSQTGGAILIGGAKTSGFITLGNGGNAGQSVITNAPALFHQGLELDGAYGIKLTPTSYTPASSQLGYAVEYTNGHTTVGTTSTALATTGATIAVGRYLVIVTYMCDTFSISTSNLTLTLTATNGTANILLGAFGASTATGGYVNGSVSGYATITTASGTLALSGVASAGTISCKNNIKLIRLA